VYTLFKDTLLLHKSVKNGINKGFKVLKEIKTIQNQNKAITLINSVFMRVILVFAIILKTA
jgi:hypothetical protein